MLQAEAEYDLSSYSYELPEEMIAQTPADPRDSSRLMALDRRGGEITHAGFRELGKFLRAGDLLVCNNTRVFPARTLGLRSTGGKVEVFFLREDQPVNWQACCSRATAWPCA